MRKSASPQIRRASSLDTWSPRTHNSEPNGNASSKRERILAAGLRLFANQTYQAVTMDRVAETAAVAKGTLYLYFPSKEALYLGILSDGLETVSKRYQATMDPRRDVGERLRHAIDTMIQFYDERRDLLRLIATEEPRLAEARNRLIQNWRERGFVFFTTLIEEGMQSGVFGQTDSRAATLAILGGIRSVLLYYGATRPAQSISEELGDFYLKGLVARGHNSRRAEQRQ
jgi:AcrR family transcriptional regulator